MHILRELLVKEQGILQKLINESRVILSKALYIDFLKLVLKISHQIDNFKKASLNLAFSV